MCVFVLDMCISVYVRPYVCVLMCGLLCASTPDHLIDAQVTAPEEFQGVCVSLINKRKGVISGSETQQNLVVIDCLTPLANMFGFSTELRSSTQVSFVVSVLGVCVCVCVCLCL